MDKKIDVLIPSDGKEYLYYIYLNDGQAVKVQASYVTDMNILSHSAYPICFYNLKYEAVATFYSNNICGYRKVKEIKSDEVNKEKSNQDSDWWIWL